MKALRGFIRFILFSSFFIWVILQLISNAYDKEVIMEEFAQQDGCQEMTLTDSITNDHHHFRTWRLQTRFSDVCTDYLSMDQLSKQQKYLREQIYVTGRTYNEYWGSVYRELVNNDAMYVQFLADSLYNLAVEKGLNAIETAELIVTFVQDIPYSYVKVDDCRNETKPCYGNAKFGILSPYEFLHTLSGDCDTRSVLLFAMLSYLGYDPMVVISEKYLHAMLALHIPASGDYIIYKNKKYYFWETTAKGWKLGFLPPSNNNVNYWKVALVQ